MLTSLRFAAAAFLMASAVPAMAVTINTSDATCLSCNANATSGTTPAGVNWVGALLAGDIFLYENANFLDGGAAFDALVTVKAVSTGSATNGWSSSINQRGVNEWMHLSFAFIEKGSASSDGSTFTARTLNELQYLNVLDIDSNAGTRSRDNFTDVAGVNLTLTGAGAALKQGGFLTNEDFPALSPEPDATNVPNIGDFTFFRLDQEWEPGNEWRNEGNFSDGATGTAADYTASFGGSNLSGFELIWGSTGTPSTNVRGFELELASAPTIAAVPVPASLPLLAAGFGALMVMRRKSKVQKM